MKIIGTKKGKPFTYSEHNKGKTWVSPSEAFEKTARETKKAIKSSKNWMS